MNIGTSNGRGRLAMLGTLLLTGLLLASAAPAGIWDDAKKLLGQDEKEETAAGSLTDDQIGSGLKEALTVGTERVVSQLGATDGFNADPAIRIPLPDSLERVRSALAPVGMSGSLDDLELQLNRAAEVATPKAKALFVNAISEMTLDDVQAIYSGPEDAATQYFRGKMSAPLAAEMTPVVDESLSQVGAVETYDGVMAQYNALPFVPPVDADLSAYVVEKGMDGIFFYLAREEAAIRADPAARTTELLKQVFGR